MWLGTPFPIDITNLNSTGGDDPQYPELELGYSAIKTRWFFFCDGYLPRIYSRPEKKNLENFDEKTRMKMLQKTDQMWWHGKYIHSRTI